MRTSVGKLIRNAIYAFVYGDEGVGKTLLPMTLADASGHGVAYVTAEHGGPTSLKSAGYPSDVPVELIGPGEDPFAVAIAGIESFSRDKTIRVVCLDGITKLFGRAIDLYSGGEGEKALGFEGWQHILAEARKMEAACDKLIHQGKSVVMTAWARPPEYTENAFGGGAALKELGRPFIQGSARFWIPGSCDIVARMTSKVSKTMQNGKPVTQWKGELQVQNRNDYIGKTRWKLPDPCPADLKWILNNITNEQPVGSTPPSKSITVNPRGAK